MKGVNFSFFFRGTMVAGRGTLVDFTRTLTIPLFARDRWRGTVDMERSRLPFPMEATTPFEVVVRIVHRFSDRAIMVRVLWLDNAMWNCVQQPRSLIACQVPVVFLCSFDGNNSIGVILSFSILNREILFFFPFRHSVISGGKISRVCRVWCVYLLLTISTPRYLCNVGK